jgi:hypothetical protein
VAFKDIHKLKKIDVVQKETIETSHLVIGKDIFALSLYNKLKNIHGAENVRLLSEDKILASDLQTKGPGTIRGETNKNIFKALYPDMNFEAGEQNALFYKDMTWKSFGGRSKPEALKFNEEFFTGPRFDVDLNTIFPELTSPEAMIDSANAEAYQVKIKKINKSEKGFAIECINGTEFFSKHLYFGLSPYKFLEVYADKNHLSDSFIQFCESTQTPSALFVKFLFEHIPLSDMKETLFIPLSYTHEWGHFVGEFKNLEEVKGKQEIEFMHFLDEDQSSEEDVSRIIRLLKKSMEKIFENFSKNSHKEFISLEQDIVCLKIDDNLFDTALQKNSDAIGGLLFIGTNAPIIDKHRIQSMFEYSTKDLNGMTRGLLVHQLCEKNLTPTS